MNSNMVADEVPNTESDGKLRIPAFDEEDPLSWKRDMTVFLRIKDRAPWHESGTFLCIGVPKLPKDVFLN